MNNYNFETGDILLFHHNNSCNSCYNCFFSCFTDAIDCFTDSKYSHIALIIKDPDFVNFSAKGLFILESSFEPFPDAVDHKYKLGVELEDFDKFINNIKKTDSIFLRKLHCDRNDEFYEKLKEIQKTIHDKPYDCLPKDWINAFFHKTKGKNARSTKRFWCSALVAYVYMELGFLSKDLAWSYVTPKMFGTEKNNKYKLEYINCTLDKEQEIFND